MQHQEDRKKGAQSRTMAGGASGRSKATRRKDSEAGRRTRKWATSAVTFVRRETRERHRMRVSPDTRWPSCLAGSGAHSACRVAGVVTHTSDGGLRMWRVSCCMNPGWGDEREWDSPVRVITDQEAGSVFAHVVPGKGPNLSEPAIVCGDLEKEVEAISNGLRRRALRCQAPGGSTVDRPGAGKCCVAGMGRCPSAGIRGGKLCDCECDDQRRCGESMRGAPFVRSRWTAAGGRPPLERCLLACKSTRVLASLHALCCFGA